MTENPALFLSIRKIGRENHMAFSIIYLNEKIPAMVCVGEKHYPGTSIELRVDKNKPHNASAKYCFNESLETLILEIGAGKKVITRYKQWPYKGWVEMDFLTNGFSEAIEFTKWLYAKL